MALRVFGLRRDVEAGMTEDDSDSGIDPERRKHIMAGQSQTPDECPFCEEEVPSLGKHLPDCPDT